MTPLLPGRSAPLARRASGAYRIEGENVITFSKGIPTET
jgi:hypothetical protein